MHLISDDISHLLYDGQKTAFCTAITKSSNVILILDCYVLSWPVEKFVLYNYVKNTNGHARQQPNER